MKPERAFNLPPVVLWSAVLLIAVHVGRLTLGVDAENLLLLTLGFTSARYGELGELLPGGAAADLWTPVTYAFLHVDAVHLVVNIVWMASFGSALARRFGASRFICLSVISAIGAAALHFVLRPADPALVIGASGAVSGMMAGTARFAFAPGAPLAGGRSPEAYRLPAETLRTVFTRSRALAFILVWFAMNLLFGLGEGLLPGASGPIAWEAHIGGFVAGLLLFPLLDPVRESEPDERLAS